MTFKAFIKSICATYFIVVTLINLATFVLGSVYRPEERFGYDAFLTPLLYAFLGILPMCVMYSKKEMTPGQVLIRKILQLVLLEVLLVGFVFGCAGLSGENGEQIASFALAVFVIFVLVHVISFVLDTEQARRMTLDLLAYQAEQEEACDAPACEKRSADLLDRNKVKYYN